MKYVFFLALAMLFASSNDLPYAQAWADQVVLYKGELNENALRKHKQNSADLVLLDKDELVMDRTGKYLRCYLINETDSVWQIQRSDAVVPGITSEIFLKNQWVQFQKPFPSMCGNSYWIQKLDENKVISMRYEHINSGPKKVKFRLRFQNFKDTIYSNVIKVDISEKHCQQVMPK